MKTSTSLSVSLLLALSLAVAGCSSSPKSRISKNQAAFDSYPAEVQTAIRAGEVRVGFTAEQVTLAAGKPDHVLTRSSETGASEVWVYRAKKSGLGVGLGIGVGSGPVGGGVGVSSGGGRYADERMRIVLADGRVTAVENVAKK